MRSGQAEGKGHRNAIIPFLLMISVVLLAVSAMYVMNMASDSQQVVIGATQALATGRASFEKTLQASKSTSEAIADSQISLVNTLQAITPTPAPLPLVEIFPQVQDGHEFVFVTGGGILSNQFVSAPNCVRDGVYGLQLTYDMKAGGNAGWGVQWFSTSAGHFDASAFKNLNFWIKGDAGAETFQVGLSDTSGKDAKLKSKPLVEVFTTWKVVTAPLSDFKEVDLASINNINFAFAKKDGAGSICIDDLFFN